MEMDLESASFEEIMKELKRRGLQYVFLCQGEGDKGIIAFHTIPKWKGDKRIVELFKYIDDTLAIIKRKPNPS
jgi:hypothetical protein